MEHQPKSDQRMDLRYLVVMIKKHVYVDPSTYEYLGCPNYIACEIVE